MGVMAGHFLTEVFLVSFLSFGLHSSNCIITIFAEFEFVSVYLEIERTLIRIFLDYLHRLGCIVHLAVDRCRPFGFRGTLEVGGQMSAFFLPPHR